MKKRSFLRFERALLAAGLILTLSVAGFFLLRQPPQAFGGNFAPMTQQQIARFQIAAKDANSAWVIDTVVGDVYLIFANGKWKDVGSIFDEKNRIRK